MNPDHYSLKTLPKFVVNTFFVMGLISAFCFRALIVLQYFDPFWVRLTWYIGLIGYLFFFLFRYYISQKRKSLITAYNLKEKINSGQPLDEHDRQAVLYILSSIVKSKENINYYTIFLLSALAIIIDIVLSITLG